MILPIGLGLRETKRFEATKIIANNYDGVSANDARLIDSNFRFGG